MTKANMKAKLLSILVLGAASASIALSLPSFANDASGDNIGIDKCEVYSKKLDKYFGKILTTEEFHKEFIPLLNVDTGKDCVISYPTKDTPVFTISSMYINDGTRIINKMHIAYATIQESERKAGGVTLSLRLTASINGTGSKDVIIPFVNRQMLDDFIVKHQMH